MVKTAIISGGCGDLGSAIGKKLSEDGFDVVALYHKTSREKAEAVLKSFCAGNHETIQCDLPDAAVVAAGIAKKKNSNSRRKVAIYLGVFSLLFETLFFFYLTDADVKEQFEVGVFGGFNFLKNAAQAMQSGMIIGMLSRVIFPGVGHPRMAAYTIGKYALRGMLRELHLELAEKPITVNAIAPGFIDNHLNSDIAPEVRKFIVERAATGMLRTADDVARAASFLCSDAGANVRGKIFSFDEKEIVDL